MCGIFGFISSKQDAVPSVLRGLMNLEHRGYDSMGAVFVNRRRARTFKVSKGEHGDFCTQDLRRKIPAGYQSAFGLGHTRWATFGAISTANAHPHMDDSGRLCIAHNGNVENAKTLLRSLNGVKFYSETDTEMIVNLVARLYRKSGNLVDAIRETIERIAGANTFVIASLDHPGELFGVTKGGSLGVARSGHSTIICSDKKAIKPFTGNDVVWLKDNDVVIVRKNDWEIITPAVMSVTDGFEQEAILNGYRHFMEQEIAEQPVSSARTLSGRLDFERGVVHLGGLAEVARELRRVKTFHFVGCGTAYHACYYATLLMHRFGVPARAWVASEFVYGHPVYEPDDAFIFVSQSGETADSFEVLQEVKIKGNICLGIVNVPDSRIWRETGVGIGLRAGWEQGVASTKAFTSQLLALTMFAVFAARQRNMTIDTAQRIFGELRVLPEKIKTVLAQKSAIKKLARKYSKYAGCYFLGRGFNYVSAMEGALKLKEVSYLHAEAYPLGEMKHGPLALIDPDFPSIIIAPNDTVFQKSVVNMHEIKGRHGRIMALADEGADIPLADDLICVPDTLEYLSPILMAVPLQLFAYYMALIKKRNPDKPRNLAKSVTVN